MVSSIPIVAPRAVSLSSVARWVGTIPIYTFRPQAGRGVKAILKADDLKQFESANSWWAMLDEIRENDYNLTAGRYCPPQAETIKHESPEALINRLLE